MQDRQDTSTAEAEAAGRSEAAAYESCLRDIESAEREARISLSGAPQPGRRKEYQASVDVDRLLARIEDLTAFRKAVLASLVWRTAQALRRLVGRSW